MQLILWLCLAIIGIAILLEICARIYHRLHFRLPFHSKVIGEYPYRSFIEKVPPPLYYRFKKGFKSPKVNINRFYCRGPEPAPDGEKNRIMVIGESNFFGAKLKKEKHLWSIKLEKILKNYGYGNWEVLNAGNPTYNTFQHHYLFENSLKDAKPRILLIEIGGNDVSQAWMFGSKWKPGEPWPWEFIMALERKSPWWNKILANFCLYFFIRRSMTERKPFPHLDDQFQWDRCIEAIGESYKKIVEIGHNIGAHIVIINYAVAYDLNLSSLDKRRLSTIQANWESFIKGKAIYDYKFFDFLRDKLSKELQIPYIDLNEIFHNHPKRFELFIDLVHFNERGMDLVAKTIYNEINKLGWWDIK